LKTQIYFIPNNSLAIIFLVVLFFSSSLETLKAQKKDTIETAIVNIVKPYSPSISDAFKIRENPLKIDTSNFKKRKVTYSTFSIPVASTFNPAKGKVIRLEKTAPLQLYDNFAFIGIGNYTNMIAQFSNNFEISATDNIGLFFKHNSSQGGIKNIYLDDQFYNSQFELNYTSNQKKMNYALKAKLKHQIYNWYGLNNLFDFASPELLNSIDSKQIYYSGEVEGNLAKDDSYFEKVVVSLGITTDRYSSSEFNFKAHPEFSLKTIDIPLKINMDIDFLNGNFSRNYSNTNGIDFGFFNVGILPSYDFNYEHLILSVGFAGYLSSDLEKSKTAFYVYPKINASYGLLNEQLIAYAGLEGGLKQNSYNNFIEQNPYLSPTLRITPTRELYDGFGGLKGELINNVSFDVRVSYLNEDDRSLFVLNPYIGQSTELEGYEYGNSFKVTYEELKTLSFFGELIFDVSKDFNVEINATFYNYEFRSQIKAWNLPKFETTLTADFNITEKFYGGLSLFFVGERTDLINNSLTIPSGNELLILDSYFDANLQLVYQFSNQLSVYARGNNLLGNNYQEWANYKVQGAQGMLGASYKFDW